MRGEEAQLLIQMASLIELPNNSVFEQVRLSKTGLYKDIFVNV